MAPIHPYHDEADVNASYFNRPEWDIGRNYAVFGRLAGVRSYDIIPISEPKGVPTNISDEVFKHWKDGVGDWHTPSYFTAKELVDVKNDKLFYRRTVSMKQYKEEYMKCDKQILPEENDIMIMWGRRPKNVISNSEMERIIALSAFWDGIDYYTDIIYEAADLDFIKTSHLWAKIVPQMLLIESNPEKIRIVFWFDN